MSFMGFNRGRRIVATIKINISSIGAVTISDDGGLTYSSTTYAPGAWTQLIASTAQNMNMVEIFDSSGNTALLGTGALGFEVALTQIVPGGNGLIQLRIDAGTRIVARPFIAVPNSTELVLNFYD